MPVEIFELPNRGDERGLSFSDARWRPFLGGIQEMHITTMRPGAVRGNHYHRLRREIIFVTYAGDWSFHWEAEANGAHLYRQFSGTGCVMIMVEREIAHAVRNDGAEDLFLVSASDGEYDPAAPDSYRREVTSTAGTRSSG